MDEEHHAKLIAISEAFNDAIINGLSIAITKANEENVDYVYGVGAFMGALIGTGSYLAIGSHTEPWMSREQYLALCGRAYDLEIAERAKINVEQATAKSRTADG